MSNSPLINKHIEDPNYSIREIGGRPCKISKITIHHAASVKATGEAVARYLKSVNDNGSANYCIGYQGDIVLCVPEEYRAWTSNSKNNDAVAVTIEVANIQGEPNWEISDISYKRLIDLCVDICRRNGMDGLVWTGDSKGTLTAHYMFAATACPGPYLKSKMPEIAAEVTKRVRELNSGNTDIQKPTIPQPEKPIEEHVITPNGGYLPAKYKASGYENGKQMTVTARSGLNCRKSAGKQYDIITTFPKGTKVMWYGYYNKDATGIRWLLVKGPKFTGYCMENFLK